MSDETHQNMAKRIVHVFGWLGALATLGLFVFGGLFDGWMHGVSKQAERAARRGTAEDKE